jgi:hypothetical protein
MLLGVWLLASSDIAPDPFDEWTPYFMKRPELEKSISLSSARDMTYPGKIWTDDNTRTIYVVERYKGLHIIDNTDPASPQRRGFIIAPGCMDVAVKDGIIYLDNAVDLVAFDPAANNGAGAVTKRLTNYFPEPASPAGERYDGHSPDMILVGWRRTNEQGGRQ